MFVHFLYVRFMYVRVLYVRVLYVRVLFVRFMYVRVLYVFYVLLDVAVIACILWYNSAYWRSSRSWFADTVSKHCNLTWIVVKLAYIFFCNANCLATILTYIDMMMIATIYISTGNAQVIVNYDSCWICTNKVIE